MLHYTKACNIGSQICSRQGKGEYEAHIPDILRQMGVVNLLGVEKYNLNNLGIPRCQ